MDVFSNTYGEARAKFLEAAERAGGRVLSQEHPAARGPDGGRLFMDAVRFGPADADVVVLTLSGTHGAEGFCGSAVQTRSMRDGDGSRLPAGVALVHVHAVNPFGFAHMLRNNENNVDLNRNWIDFTAPLPENPLYAEIHPTFPTRLGTDEDLIAEWRAAWDAARKAHGDWAAQDALSRGQYTHPDGIEFGGFEPQWSRLALTRLLGETCRGARHVAYLDWHTLVRIGDGKLVFLCFNQTGDHLYGRTARWWGAAAVSRETVNAQWASGIAGEAKRPSRCGLAMWGVQHELAPGTDVAGAVIEFCADKDAGVDYDQLEAREATYSRYLFATRDYDSRRGREMTEFLRENTSPSRPAFRAGVLSAGADALAKATAGAGAWAAEDVPADPGTLVRVSAFT